MKIFFSFGTHNAAKPLAHSLRSRFVLLLLLIALFEAPHAWAQLTDTTWNSGSNSTWNTAANWSPATIPNANTVRAVIGTAAGTVVTLDTSPTIGGLSIASGYTLERASGDTTNRTLTIAAATAANNFFSNSGLISSGGTSGTLTLRLTGGGSTFANSGTLQAITGTTLELRGNTNPVMPTLTNTGGTIQTVGTGTLRFSAFDIGSGQIGGIQSITGGTLSISSGGTMTTDGGPRPFTLTNVAFTNNGTVNWIQANTSTGSSATTVMTLSGTTALVNNGSMQFTRDGAFNTFATSQSGLTVSAATASLTNSAGASLGFLAKGSVGGQSNLTTPNANYTITNNGTITLESQSTVSRAYLTVGATGSNALTLGGNGSLVLRVGSGGNASNVGISGSSAVLINGAGHTIRGAGTIGAGTLKTITNNGAITADDATSALTVNMAFATSDNSQIGVLTNNGDFTATGAGGLVLNAVNFTNNGNFTIGANSSLTMNKGFVVTNNAGKTMTINGTWVSGSGGGSLISNAGTLIYGSDTNSTVQVGQAGAGNFIKNGNGTLTLTGANTATGDTTINAGKLVVSTGNATSLTVSNVAGPTVTLTSGNTTGLVVGQSVTGGQITGILTSTTFLRNGAATSPGSTSMTAAAYSTLSSGNLTVNGGEIDLGGVNQTVKQVVVAGGTISNGTLNTSVSNFDGQSGTVSATLNGTSKTLTKTTGGTLTLSGNNTYTGTTTISAGTLALGHSGALGGGGNITFGGGVLQYSANNTVDYSSRIVGSSGGPIHIDTNGQDVTFSNALGSSNVGGLTKAGAGNLNLSVANAYTGATTINAGTLSVGVANALGATGGNITLGGGTLRYGTGVTQDYSSRFSTAANQAYNIDTNGNTVTYASALTSSGAALTKNGTGLLTLSSASNTYSGATTINGGTLALTNGNTNTAITVNSGATLLSSGTVGNVTVNSGAFISPGASSGAIGNLYVNNTLTLNGGGSYLFNIDNVSGVAGTNWDLITVGGGSGTTLINANSGNKFTISISGAASLLSSSNYSWKILDSGALTGFDSTAFTLGSTFSGLTGNWSLTDTSGDLTLLYTGGAATPTWSGGTGTWSTGFSPSLTEGSTLTFTGASAATATNDIASGNLTSVGTITFNSGAGSFTLNANAGSSGYDASMPLLVNGTVTNASNATQTLNLALSFPQATNVNANAGDLVLNGPVVNQSGLTFAGANNTSVNGALSGNGGLTKSGDGILTLNATNTYAGNTSVVAGVLTLSGGNAISDSTAVSIASSGTLNLASSEGLGSVSGTGNITLGANTLTTGLDNTSTTFSGVVSGSGALVKQGTGALTLGSSNTYTGATTINSGTLSIDTISNAGVAGSLGNSTSAAVNLILGGGALQYTSGSVNGSTNRNFTLANGTSNIMNVATSGISLTISGNAAASTGSLTKTGSGILVLSGANAYTGSTTISSGTLSVASINNGGVAGGLGSSSANAANLILDGGTLLFTGSTASTDRGFTLANGKNSTISVTGSSATLTISGNSTATTTGGLIKDGASTLSLTGSNGFSGSVSVVSGTLSAATIGNQGESSSLGSGAAILLGSGSNTVGLTYTGTGQVSNKTIDLSGTTGGVYISQSGSSGTLNFTSNFTATGTGSKTIYLQGSTAGIGQISGTIVDNSALNKTSINKSGSGTWVLSGNNTYSGETIISSGVLSVSSIKNTSAGASSLGNPTNFNDGMIKISDQATLLYTGTGDTTDRQIALHGYLPNATSTIDQSGSGTLRFTYGSFGAYISNNQTLVIQGSTSGIGEIASAVVNNNATFTTGLRKNGTGTWILSGANTYTGATTINAGTLQIGNGSSTGSLSVSSSITNNGTLVFNRSGTVTQGTDFANGISGSGNLTQAGSGNLIINSANSYSGATTVANGTLTIAGSGTLGTSAISISGGTLDLGGKSLTNTLGSLTGGTLANGTITNDGGNYALQNGTVSAILAGTNGVNKTTSGTVTLNGANTYTGTTTVSSGTLTAAASGAMGNSTVINVTGGSFLVTAANAVSDSTNINLDGGTLALSGNFSENVGQLTLSKDSIIDFAGFVGTLRFSGVGSWAPSANLAIWNWSGVPRYGDPVNNYATPSNLVFTNNSTLTSNLSNISFYSDSGNSFVGSGFEVSGFSGGGSEIIAVPEPEAFFYAVALLAGLAVQYLRRRAKHREGHRPAWPKFLLGRR